MQTYSFLVNKVEFTVEADNMVTAMNAAKLHFGPLDQGVWIGTSTPRQYRRRASDSMSVSAMRRASAIRSRH